MIGAVGVVVGAFGAWLLLSRQDLDQLTERRALAGRPASSCTTACSRSLTLAAGARSCCGSCPRAARAPAVVGFVVLGSVTLLAVPVLGRFGARPDNATLLDRHYLVAWLVLAALTRGGGRRRLRSSGRARS